jgi:TetR/AcrR family transcriptional regulator, regulator of cefoperazone and chloramphenicol sensitivity
MTKTATRRRARPSPTRPASGSQRRADRTRAAIVAETVRCVLDEGFAAASANHIAERAGVTWGVIQYHFGDRDGLLEAVLDEGFRHLRESVAGIDLPRGETRERVQALVAAAWRAFATPTSRASLEIVIATRGRRDRRFERHLAQMGRDLARLGADLVGALDLDVALGGLLWATLRGLAITQMSVEDPIDASTELAALVDVLTVYLEERAP